MKIKNEQVVEINKELLALTHQIRNLKVTQGGSKGHKERAMTYLDSAIYEMHMYACHEEKQ